MGAEEEGGPRQPLLRYQTFAPGDSGTCPWAETPDTVVSCVVTETSQKPGPRVSPEGVMSNDEMATASVADQGTKRAHAPRAVSPRGQERKQPGR